MEIPKLLKLKFRLRTVLLFSLVVALFVVTSLWLTTLSSLSETIVFQRRTGIKLPANTVTEACFECPDMVVMKLKVDPQKIEDISKQLPNWANGAKWLPGPVPRSISPDSDGQQPSMLVEDIYYSKNIVYLYRNCSKAVENANEANLIALDLRNGFVCYLSWKPQLSPVAAD